MITITEKKNPDFYVEFMKEEDVKIRNYKYELEKVYHGKYLEVFYLPMNHQAALFIGYGKEKPSMVEIKEIFAKTSKTLIQYGVKCCSMDVSVFIKQLGIDVLRHIVMGLSLGEYEFNWKESKEKATCEYQLYGLERQEEVVQMIQEAVMLSEEIMFARNMVNMPGNHLRPMDFARAIQEYMATLPSDAPIEIQTLVYGELKAIGMQALAGIGGSSEYPPCLFVIRYKGDPESSEITGLIGKGVTCDTGGYCLKGAKSMSGIKGDMAGAAAVVGAIHGLAKQKIKVNVTACLPLCENRISMGAYLPGDVITGYSGKTIEILNTDAEGRLILSDALSYGIKEEGMTKVLDIATLTGAVWNTLGFTIGGAMSDNDEFYQEFEKGLQYSAETYLRFPFGKEHEKMIKSNIAEIKNMGADCCGTITAGLFIRAFAENKPWIHLDIAGTAWTDNPNFEFESKGATGAGVTSIYFLLKQ